MKTFNLLVAALIIFFSSCKKEYSCECIVTSNPSTTGSYVPPSSTGSLGKMKKKDAEAKCDQGDSNTTNNGVNIVSECSIK